MKPIRVQNLVHDLETGNLSPTDVSAVFSARLPDMSPGEALCWLRYRLAEPAEFAGCLPRWKRTGVRDGMDALLENAGVCAPGELAASVLDPEGLVMPLYRRELRDSLSREEIRLFLMRKTWTMEVVRTNGTVSFLEHPDFAEPILLLRDSDGRLAPVGSFVEVRVYPTFNRRMEAWGFVARRTESRRSSADRADSPSSFLSRLGHWLRAKAG